MISFGFMSLDKITESFHQWLADNAGKIIIKARVWNDNNFSLMIFYEDVPKIRTKIGTFSEEAKIVDWLKRMQTAAEQNGTHFRVVQGVSTLIPRSGDSPQYVLRDIYYEEEVAEEKTT